MADIEARREARRRKILENAEKRMKILTNQYENEKEEAGNKTDENKKDNTCTSNNAIKEEDFIVTSSGTVKPEVKQQTEPENLIKPGSVQTELRQRGIKNTVKIQRNVDSSGTDVQNSNEEAKITKDTETDVNITLKQVEGLKISSFVLLAIICRLVLKCGFGLLYFQSIFLPFVVMEGGWTMYQTKHSLQLPRKRNKMSTVLLLCGIKPDMLFIYDRIMGYVTTFSEDFGLFVFSFFVGNLLIS